MKQNIIKRLLIFIITILATTASCSSLISKYRLNTEKTTLRLFINNHNKKSIVFIPMMHIAKPEFYNDVHQKIDSLRTEGYLFYYESVAIDTITYSQKELHTLRLKQRKLLGFYLSKELNDSTNQSLPDFYKNNKYIPQHYKNIGITRDDVKADLPMDSLISIYEYNHGTVKLTDCDYDTPLSAKYNCNNGKTPSSMFEIVHIYREKHLEKMLMEEQHNKIAIVYGKAHFNFLPGFLIKNGYNEIKLK